MILSVINNKFFTTNGYKEFELNSLRRFNYDFSTKIFKLKLNISNNIRAFLKSKGLSKNYKSIKNCLPHTIEELKNHIERQFEP